MKKQLGILSIALAAFIAAGTAFGQPVKKAEAASLKTNIFNEEVEEDKLADNNKWVTSKKDTTIDIKNVGKDILHYTADSASGLTLMQHNNAVTLSAKQYVEFTLTFEGMLAASFVDFAFSPEKIEKGDKVEVNFDTGVITNLTKNETYQAEPFPEFIQNIINKGGLLNSIKEK